MSALCSRCTFHTPRRTWHTSPPAFSHSHTNSKDTGTFFFCVCVFKYSPCSYPPPSLLLRRNTKALPSGQVMHNPPVFSDIPRTNTHTQPYDYKAQVASSYVAAMVRARTHLHICLDFCQMCTMYTGIHETEVSCVCVCVCGFFFFFPLPIHVIVVSCLACWNCDWILGTHAPFVSMP